MYVLRFFRLDILSEYSFFSATSRLYFRFYFFLLVVYIFENANIDD